MITESMIIEFALGLVTCAVLFSYGRSALYARHVSFLSSTVIAGTFFYSRIVTYFDEELKLFQVMMVALVLTAAVTGGVVGVLLPKISTGATLGFFIALFSCSIVLACGGEPHGSVFIAMSALFVVAISASIYLAQKFERTCSAIRSALVVGFLFALSVDTLVADQPLRSIFFSIIGSDADRLCKDESCADVHMMLVWSLSSLAFVIYSLYEAGSFKSLSSGRSVNNPQSRQQYKPVPSIAPATAAAVDRIERRISTRQRTFSYPDALVFNYFDPDNIPEPLQPYADTIFIIVQQLAQVHGFQIDNSRNQAEHLLMLLFNETLLTDDMVSRPAMRIHNALFANYRKWCARMSVRTNLLKDVSAVKSFDHLIEDSLMLLLIWGEAANLKHMPECLCFLLHKTMGEHIDMKQDAGTLNAVSGASFNAAPLSPLQGRYPGFFLDMVVTPIYEVVAEAFKQSSDHFNTKSYDDFNEFFWSPNCMKFRLHEMQGLHTEFLSDNSNNGNDNGSTDAMHAARNAAAAASEDTLLLSVALRNCSKTYLEKRSWLHPLISMNRVFEWHAITFTLLAAWAYAGILQWTYAFTLQVGSFVFWEITFFSILWTALEVWTLFPNVRISDPSVCGYLVRLLFGLIILTYQSVYYHWSFVDNSNSSLTSIDMYQATQAQYEDNGSLRAFWWWQYVWLSLIACSVYFLESVLCLVPSVVSALMTWDNDFVQAFLSICYPFSQLYVGKNMYIAQSSVFRYVAFWICLLAFKLWFGFRYIVSPVCSPSLLLYDDYMNFFGGPEQFSFAKTSVLIFFWWFPHFLVYLIDLSIWYSVMASIIGGFKAIVDRQGAVRETPSFRSHFLRAPLAFCQRMMPSDSELADSTGSNWHVSTKSLTDLSLIARAPSRLLKPVVPAAPHSSKAIRSRSSAALSMMDSGPGGSLYQSVNGNSNSLAAAANASNGAAHSMLEVLDIRNQRWVVFAKVWNEIIRQLRKTDHMSNAEESYSLFSYFDWLTLPVYLPLYQTAGCVWMAANMFKEAAGSYKQEKDIQQQMTIVEKFYSNLGVAASEAVFEAWELMGWLMQLLLGNHHIKDVQRIFLVFSMWGRNNTDLFARVDASAVEKLLSHAKGIVGVLKGALDKRKMKPVITPDFLIQHEAQQKLNGGTNSNGIVDPGALKPEYKSVGSANVIKKSVSTNFLAALSALNVPDESSKTTTVVNNGSGDEPSAAIEDKRTGQVVFQKMQPFRKAREVSDNVRDKVREDVRNFFQLLRNALKVAGVISSEAHDLVDRIVFLLNFESGFLWSGVYASAQIDQLCAQDNVPAVLNKLHGLLNLRSAQVELRSVEANRRLNFFMNSLFMDMPGVPSMRFSKEYTCITPYYSEDILLSKSTLAEKNSDGVSTLLYLQTLYKDDWVNFIERRGISDDSQIWSKKHIQEVRMWASCRAQTLFRTVEGMMYSEAAVRLLADLEDIDTVDVNLLAKTKFNYVVACQVYGEMKRTTDSKADDIDFLLARYPNLRVAYIDSIPINREGGKAFYSVLIKHDMEAAGKGIINAVKEVYRVKLPGNPVIGEGKPENQNHAIIFTRGRFLQAIDMNQDGYFEEALKMRNLLEEFQSGCAILGFREFIFTGTVSSVANYMAMQELSFVTLGQRVLNEPLRIRQHYGHPDLFNKIFVMTEGGMSKASKGINLSEDVFAGFNATIRGHSVQFKEYVQVGKGRDVGLQQTYKFEAKLSQGNAEQSLSRDLSRICARLDFFRLFSFYYGGIGHYMANAMVMFTLVVVVYTLVCRAVYQEEGVNGRPEKPEGILQILLAGMGLLQTLPLLVTLTVEKGTWQALTEVASMMISGGPLYFIFHIQTKSYYFAQTLMAGGAVYRPTGRGFVTRHSPFDENYRFFATSHIYMGFELFAALILFGAYTTSKQYAGITWALWLTAVSFMLGPFWFNPLTFEWTGIKKDYVSWLEWMEERAGSAEQAWETWWKEEISPYAKLSASWKVFLLFAKCAVWVFLSVGITGHKFFNSQGEQQKMSEIFAIVAAYVFGNWVIVKLERQWTYAVRRFASLVLNTAALVLLVLLFAHHPVCIRYAVALYYFVAALSFFLVLLGAGSQVVSLYKLHDYLVGHTIFFLICLLTLLQLGYIQTWLLYHSALSEGVAIDDILMYARKIKERANADDSETVADLRKQVSEQQKLIQQIINSSSGSNSSGGGSIELSERSSIFQQQQSGGKSSGYGSIGHHGSAFDSVKTAAAVSDNTSKAAVEHIIAKPAAAATVKSPRHSQPSPPSRLQPPTSTAVAATTATTTATTTAASTAAAGGISVGGSSMGRRVSSWEQLDDEKKKQAAAAIAAATSGSSSNSSAPPDTATTAVAAGDRNFVFSQPEFPPSRGGNR